MSAETLPESVLTDGDHDKFSHYLRYGGVGEVSEALCGKRWTPTKRLHRSEHDPCPTCLEIAEGRYCPVHGYRED